MRYQSQLVLTSYLALLSCAATGPAPRVTTPEERARAQAALTDTVTILITLRSLEVIDGDEFKLATEQVAVLRDDIKVSATEPVMARSLLQRVLNFAYQWSTLKDKHVQPPAEPDSEPGETGSPLGSTTGAFKQLPSGAVVDREDK